jgi:hypothetical protein
VKELLEYRESALGEVEPVRVERTPGRVRVVARYSRQQRARARNRFLFAAAISIGWMLGVARMRILCPRGWWGVLWSLWMIGVIVTMIMVKIWWRTAWIFVFDATRRELKIEEKGLLWGWTWTFQREHIIDVLVVRDRRGRGESLLIQTRYPKVPRTWLEGFDGKYLTEAAEALREGLGMEKQTPPYNGADDAGAARAGPAG